MASAEKCKGGAGGRPAGSEAGARPGGQGQRWQSGRCERVAHGSPGSRRDEGGGGGRDDRGRRTGHGMSDSFRLWHAPGSCGGVSGTCELGVGRSCPSPDAAPCRCVWVEKESINSVIISDAPEDLHQRILVAASLSVNATGELGRARASPALSASVPPAPPHPAPGAGTTQPWGGDTGLCRLQGASERLG